MSFDPRVSVLSKRPMVLATTALILCGLVYLFYVTTLMPGSILPGYAGDAFFPQMVLVFTAVFGSLVLIFGIRRARRGAPGLGGEPADATVKLDLLETGIVAAVAIAYMLLLENVGHEIATTLFVFALLWPRLFAGPIRATVVAAVGALVTMLLVYAVFVLGLGIFLPLRWLPRYIG